MNSFSWKQPCAWFATLALILTGASCSRSAKQRDDQAYYKDEPPSYYNQGQSGKPTQRIEAMGQPKKRVTVLGFWNDTPVKSKEIGPFAAEEMKRGLFATQRVIIPTDATTELTTEDFVKGDQVKVAQLIREGRRLGVSILVIGRVTKVVFRTRGDEIGVFRQRQALAGADVEVKVFDVLGGREINALVKSGEASSNNVTVVEDENLSAPGYRVELTKFAVRDAVTRMLPDVVKTIEKMGWQGNVAKIVSNKVYVNAGKQSGLVAGDILKVLTVGEDIYDPSTGAYLGRTQGQLKGTIEIVDFIGTDGAVGELHTGGNFQEGDLVKLY